MATVGPEYELLFANVNGRNSDGGIWAKMFIKKALESNAWNIPDPTPLPGKNIDVPFVCTGGRCIPSSKIHGETLPQYRPDKRKRIFNYRLSHMRRIEWVWYFG